MSDRATHCPSCGATVHSITRESGGRWSGYSIARVRTLLDLLARRVLEEIR